MQDMLYVMKTVLDSLGFKIKLPMVLEMDNQGVMYLANNSSVGGKTRHIDVQSVFLQELKVAEILTNEADIFTKNLDGPTV
jgi:hypothetical protein